MRRYILGGLLVAALAFGWGAPARGWENLQQGRMTGGGVFMCFDETGFVGDVTYGFELHCDASTPNNLEINWGGGNHFHLDVLTKVECVDEPNISPNPPAAPFDTLLGQGTGSFNNMSGASIVFFLQDAGEPGTSDTVSMTIRDASNNVVLTCETNTLSGGNNQAHTATP